MMSNNGTPRQGTSLSIQATRSPKTDSALYEQDDSEAASERVSQKKRPQFYSQYFKRYELMIEFTNLRNPSHCPSGIYMMPSLDNMNVWYGTIFVHKGYYRNGIFKFKLVIPQEYPDKAPSVDFINDVFHPLVDVYRRFSLKQRFPHWTPHKDFISHILYYIKSSFKKSVLDNLQQHNCPNQEAWLMYRNKPEVFAEFAKNCAEYSVMDSNLYGDHQGSSSIRFNKLSDQKFEELKTMILNRSVHPNGSGENETEDHAFTPGRQNENSTRTV
ncbi:hypothetical protein K7432_011296 [Basidiobolus ranarum]|uniref:UBC core domain-containing protein n=1 Tax=Basidiobolus ranarum TaxID=34480 RepID=A0ABR2VU40_9FUNG